MTLMGQGGLANSSGRTLETTVVATLQSKGFATALYRDWLKQPAHYVPEILLRNVPYQTLYGLYEGVPLTKRNAGYQFILPDRITIFKLPITQAVSSIQELKAQVKHTLWHEIAHYYGLDHDRIHQIEHDWKS